MVVGGMVGGGLVVELDGGGMVGGGLVVGLVEGGMVGGGMVGGGLVVELDGGMVGGGGIDWVVAGNVGKGGNVGMVKPGKSGGVCALADDMINPAPPAATATSTAKRRFQIFIADLRSRTDKSTLNVASPA